MEPQIRCLHEQRRTRRGNKREPIPLSSLFFETPNDGSGDCANLGVSTLTIQCYVVASRLIICYGRVIHEPPRDSTRMRLTRLADACMHKSVSQQHQFYRPPETMPCACGRLRAVLSNQTLIARRQVAAEQDFRSRHRPEQSGARRGLFV